MPADLQSIVDRAKTDTLTPTDIQALVAAIQSGQVTLVTGQQAIGIGSSADESIIVTGNRNLVLNGADTATIMALLQQFQPVSSTPPPQTPQTSLPQFPEACQFDLTQLIDQGLAELLGKRGLVGLAIPCGEKAFLKHFCDRLKQELGRSNIQIRQPLSLNPQVISVQKAVQAIQQYRKLLHTGDVICPIRIGIRSVHSNIPQQFWQQLQDAFQGEFKYRLIVVMVGSFDGVFPPDVLRLNPPRFEQVHAFQWIRDITRALNWMHLNEEWLQKMIDRCLSDELSPDCLDVGLVYEHLDYTLSLLQRDPPLSAAEFLEQLD